MRAFEKEKNIPIPNNADNRVKMEKDSTIL